MGELRVERTRATNTQASTMPLSGPLQSFAAPIEGGASNFSPLDGVQSSAAPSPLGREIEPPAPRDKAAAAAKLRETQLKTFDAKVDRIKKNPTYLALDADSRRQIDESMGIARTRTNANYYADKMSALINTKNAPPANNAAAHTTATNNSLATVTARLDTPQGRADLDKEEKLTADPKRNWTVLNGDNATYRVDRSDPNNVHVHMKVALIGDPAEVAKIKAIEDQIEKEASGKGYTFDVEFVDKCGPDVFEANVDPTKWANSGNWTGSAHTLAHEAHHRLGLADRYDYIESHATNADMKMEDRIHWFREQMNRPYDPAGPNSLMGGGTRLLPDDVCKVAQAPDQAACETARKRTTGVR